MARRIEHSSTFDQPATSVYAVLVDRAFLAARLAAMGGNSAALLTHEVTEQKADITIRHSIDSGDLPSGVRTLLNGDLNIQRAETWQAEPGGRYAGTFAVTINGVPGEMNGRSRLADNGSGSEYLVGGEVRVAIPLFGGKIEETVVEHIRKLLDAEHEFARRWLAEH